VGAADDPAGKSGLAHYHEHLMFKGTPDVGSGEFTRRIEALGGQFNAFTGADFTGYYVNIAREHLALVMQLEADRMQNLSPAESDYATELEVVVEERQSRIGSRPSAQLNEQMQAAMFMHHPYRIPIIGWMHEIKALTPNDARAFYDKYYHAGNMVLVVAGDISRDELEPLAEQYYGSLEARAPATHNWAQEPDARSAKRVVLRHAEVNAPRLQRRYLAPSYGAGDATQVMPLSLYAEWLGGGKSSVLYQALVEEKKLAVSVSAGYSGFARGPSQFSIHAQPAPDVSIEALEAVLDKVLAEALQTRIMPADLQRIKTLFSASAIYARDGLTPLAHYAGYLAMLELPLEFLTQWEGYVDAVTPEQMQAAAKAVLQPQQSVTGMLLPKKASMEAPDETH
jgi:zinc protease